jgi:hypothetical protein
VTKWLILGKDGQKLILQPDGGKLKRAHQEDLVAASPITESGKRFSQVVLSATAHMVPLSLPKYRSLIDEDREITDG